jgi:hypothetical protein
MRADIHDGPEHNTLQPEAGYIDARPQLPDRQKPLATHGRTIQTPYSADVNETCRDFAYAPTGHTETLEALDL